MRIRKVINKTNSKNKFLEFNTLLFIHLLFISDLDDGFGMIDANPTISKKKLMLTQGYETKNDGIFYNGNMSITFNRDFKCFLNLLYLGY